MVPVKGGGNGLRDAPPPTLMVLSLSLVLLHLSTKVVPFRQEGQALSDKDHHQDHKDDDENQCD